MNTTRLPRPTHAQITRALLVLDQLQVWTNGYNNDAVRAYIASQPFDTADRLDEALVYAKTACETLQALAKREAKPAKPLYHFPEAING